MFVPHTRPVFAQASSSSSIIPPTAQGVDRPFFKDGSLDIRGPDDVNPELIKYSGTGHVLPPRDVLLIRAGFMPPYKGRSVAGQARLDVGPTRELAARASSREQPLRGGRVGHAELEHWPAPKGVPHLHQTLLGRGMPIGEFFDLEALSTHCAETSRYSFCFSSWPLNFALGGIGRSPNAAAYFGEGESGRTSNNGVL
ncbi:uncharacterized protein BXZ73DRAFT_107574 [Epithele typhae]|uniref:uncharacterized protein n=1 Tax=Epithele typhae TaxID=378194 RepID=UPI0020089A66|nr:uncharacterized protein BXZ73DRAFT_107574 [Epithele typhae]KAH9912205.1 hypothetical protein BXZ73DRAFT_107574 [Epithele typhae]